MTTPSEAPATERDPSPWDVYHVDLDHMKILEGSWDFNTKIRLLLNGTTERNGQKLSEPVEVSGTVRGFWDTPRKGVGFFLKADDDSKRSVEINFRKVTEVVEAASSTVEG